MFTSLRGRSVLVTGGTRGIGKGIAAAFAANGASVAIVGRDKVAGELSARDIGAGAAGSVIYIHGDVSDPASCAEIVATAVELSGGLDVLCCNAGIFPAASLREMTPELFEEVLAVNLKGTVFTVQAAMTPLQESGHGRVIVTSSITGPITGFTGWSHYGASKAGQLGFLRSAALELAKARITINAIMPGNIITEGLADLGPEYLRTMEASIPLGRLGSVEEIGHAAVFLASDEAAYITGQALVIDGGQTIPESLEAMG
ncbi:MAG: 3-oxoacyl-ACP reductase FabG [Streptosporangiaceae bacterium]